MFVSHVLGNYDFKNESAAPAKNPRPATILISDTSIAMNETIQILTPSDPRKTAFGKETISH